MKKNNQKKEFNVFKYIKEDNKLVIAIICLILFIMLTIFVLTGKADRLDELMSSFIIGIRNDSLTKRMINITNIGGAYSLIVISLLLLIFIKKRKIPLLVILNLITVFLTSQLLKYVFKRPRPDGVFLINESGYSFPSGHAMVSTAYILFIIYILNRIIKNKITKVVVSIALSILILLIGFSRIYLGVHHFTDVIGGFLLGISYLMIFLHIINKKEYLK